MPVCGLPEGARKKGCNHMKARHFYHTKPHMQARIKVCEKTITWERLQPNGEWRYDARRPLPVNNAEMLRDMYALPDDVVVRPAANNA